MDSINAKITDIHIGSRVHIDGLDWECTQLNAGSTDIVRLRQVNGEQIRKMPISYLADLNEEGRASLIRHVIPRKQDLMDIYDLSPAERRDFERCCAGATIFLAHANCSRKKAYNEFLSFCERQNEQFLEEHKLSPKPAQKPATVQKWRRQYLSAGDFSCFVRKDSRTQYRARQYPENIEKLVTKVILNCYANDRKPRMTQAYRTLLAEAQAEFMISIDQAKSMMPSYRTFVRRIEESDHFEVLSKRLGKHHTRRLAGYGKRIGYPEFIGGRAEVDCTRADVMVYDEKLDHCYRPWLMVMIDVYTRCIIAWDLSSTAPSATKFSRVYRNAIGADGYPYRCVPSMMVVDNGSEFVNGELCTQIRTFGSRVEFAPPRSPKGKSFCERFFGTANEYLFHQLEGTTQSNPQERGDYDAEEHAIYSIETLNERWEEFLGAYHDEYHRGLEDTPRLFWENVVSTPENTPRTLPFDEAQKFGTKSTRVRINGGRVRLDNLYWTAPSLPELNLKLRAKAVVRGGSEGKTPEVLLRYNEHDLTQVYVSDPQDLHSFIICDPLEPAYQTGLTMDVHKKVRANLRARGKALKNRAESLGLRYALERKLAEDKREAGQSKRKKSQLRESAERSSKGNFQDQVSYKEILDEENSQDENFLNDLGDDFDSEADY